MLISHEAHRKASDLKEQISVPQKLKRFYGKFSSILVRIYFKRKNTGRKNSRDVLGFVFFDLKNHGQLVPLASIPIEARSPREFTRKAQNLAYDPKTIRKIFNQ